MGRGAIDLFRANPHPYGSKRSRIGDLPLLLGITPGGSLAQEITTPGEGQLRALFVDSGNPVLSYPRGDRLEQALEQLELMVSLDLYITETTRYSDYILPATTFLERPDLNELWGANAPRPWIQYSDAVIPPPGEARNEYAIYAEILERMGLPAPLQFMAGEGEAAPDPIAAADRLLRAGAWGEQRGDAGLSVARLKADYPSGYRLAERVNASETQGYIAHADGKAHLWGELQAAELRRLQAQRGAETGAGTYPLKLFGRRRLQSLNSWMHNSERLTRRYQPTLQMHPRDAELQGIQSGQRVRVSSNANSLELLVEVTDEVVQGSVSYPHGWGHRGGWQRANSAGGANVNLLASDNPRDWEQVSGICLLDGIPVRVEPA